MLQKRGLEGKGELTTRELPRSSRRSGCMNGRHKVTRMLRVFANYDLFDPVPELILATPPMIFFVPLNLDCPHSIGLGRITEREQVNVQFEPVRIPETTWITRHAAKL